MNTSTFRFRTFVFVLLLSVAALSSAIPTETEYRGVLVHEGYLDEGIFGAPIGFNFNFYGNTYSTLFINVNGIILFGSSVMNGWLDTIPSTQTPNNFIAPFWDDLVIDATGDLMYQTIGTSPNRKFVIQYRNMAFYGSTIRTGTFQVILYEGSNNIQMQYRSVANITTIRGRGATAVIGIENANGTMGVCCSYLNSPYVYPGRAILLTPGGPGYTYDENALYDPLVLTQAVPKAAPANPISPAQNSTVGEVVQFEWEAAANAASYNVIISPAWDLSDPIHVSPDLTGLSYEFTLNPDSTYFWAVEPKNSEGISSWSEIRRFYTSISAPLTAIPQTLDIRQGDMESIRLRWSGGAASGKTATIRSLPAEGTLYQDNGGSPGAAITSVPTVVSSESKTLFYSAINHPGSGLGSFDFQFNDLSYTSAITRYSINVLPHGIPNFVYASKATDRVEITFDRNMADPTGKQNEFAVQVNGGNRTITSCELKAGDPKTIVLKVTPAIDLGYAVTVAYTRGTVLAESSGALESFGFQLAGKRAQSINFDALPDRIFGDPDFTLIASASSGLPVRYGSSNPEIVSLSGSTASVNNLGESIITVTQDGNATYAPARKEQLQRVTKTQAVVNIGNLYQEYTGSGIAATVGTVPAGLDVVVTYNGSPALPVNVGSYTVRGEVVDEDYYGSNSAQLEIYDGSDPVPDIDPLPDLSGECSLTPGIPTATDAYAGTILGTTTTPFPITALGTTVITWTYDDGYGNVVTQNQNVFLEDTNDPSAPTLEVLTGECSVTAVAPITTDNCAGTITGTTSDPLTYEDQGSYVIHWTFDDGNGNSIQVAQDVIVSDVSDPLTPALEDLRGDCSITAVPPTTTDNCAGTITGTTSDPLTYDTQGNYVIQWTFDDGNGNSIQVPQNVVVDDILPPEAIPPADVIACNGSAGSIALQSITDNCSIPAVSYELTGATAGSGTGDASVELFNPGLTTVTYTLTDGNGNSSQYAFTVSYEEIEECVVSLIDGTLTIENSGTYQWINCDGNTMIEGETASSFTPSISGVFAVILTQGSCSDTSDCYRINISGLDELSLMPDYKVYPNPAHDYVTLALESEQTNVSVSVFDITGKLVLAEKFDRLISVDLDISGFREGMYVMHFHSDQHSGLSRLLKE